MELIEKSSEAEMIAEFLKGEIRSERFGDHMQKLLYEFDLDSSIILHPNLADEEENALRKKILAEHRGYGKNQGLFEDFPKNIQWHIATITPDELKKVKYIADDYWNTLSDGSRLATIAAKRIKEGTVVYNQPNDKFFQAAEAIQQGASLPRLILLTRNETSPLVVLEGHVRLTAYMLDPNAFRTHWKFSSAFQKN